MIFHRVIVVTGTPGVGKSVCSSLLASRLEARHIDLGEFVREQDLTLGVDPERGTAIADIDGLSASLSTVLEASRQDFVVEGLLAPYVLDHPRVELTYVLRCDPDELILRLRKKGFSEPKALENAASEILGICLWDAVGRFGKEKVAEVDTTSRSPEDVVEEMVDILSGRLERMVGRIDWLSSVSEQGRLSYFFT